MSPFSNVGFMLYLSVPDPEKLGLEDGSIPDGSLSASSNWEPHDQHTDTSTPAGGRLNNMPPDADTIGKLFKGCECKPTFIINLVYKIRKFQHVQK